MNISEASRVSFSMGALWAIAGAMFVALGLLCAGLMQGQKFIDSFEEFKTQTLAYERAAEHDRKVVGVQLANVTSWQKAADDRRKINFPTLVNESSWADWSRDLAQRNADVLHADQAKRGLDVPKPTTTPLVGLPEATILPLPAAPAGDQ